jgi:hypothetical protein
MRSNHSVLRRLAGVAVATIVGGTIALVAPLGASAAKPDIGDRFSDGFEEVVDFCEQGPFTISEQVKGVEKGFFDKDGNLSRATIQLNGTTTLTSEYGELFDRWAWAGTYDAETDTFTERGNQFNVHAGAGGILVNDSGLIRFTFVEDEFVLLRVARPRDSFPDGPGDPCGVLFPS